MSSIGPSLPFRLQNVYGSMQPPQPAAPPATSPTRTEPIAKLASRPEPVRPTAIGRLVAGAVEGGIDFSTDRPQPGDLPLYRHPADQNAAALAVQVGRSLDVQA